MSVLDTIYGAASGAVNAVTSAVSDVAEPVVSAVQNVISPGVEAAKSAVGAGASVGQQVIGGVKNVISPAVSAGQQVIESVPSAISSLSAPTQQVGATGGLDYTTPPTQTVSGATGGLDYTRPSTIAQPTSPITQMVTPSSVVNPLITTIPSTFKSSFLLTPELVPHGTYARAGFYEPSQLGDAATQARARELVSQPYRPGTAQPFGSYADAVRYALEEQRQSATDSTSRRFYTGELTKAVSEPIEAASEYHYQAKETGLPQAANPYEYQADLAVELLKGAPVTRSDVFSPVSGEMSKYLPGGKEGIQQYQWNTALGKNENVSFMPGLAALQAAEGIEGPYGALYGGTGAESITPESVERVTTSWQTNVPSSASVVTEMPMRVSGVGPDVTVKSAAVNVPTVGGLYIVPGSGYVMGKGVALPSDVTTPIYQQRSDIPAVALEAGVSALDALTSLPSTVTFGVIPAWKPGTELLTQYGQTGSPELTKFQTQLAAVEEQRPSYDAILSEVKEKTDTLNTLTAGKINEQGQFTGTPEEYANIQKLQSDIKTGTNEYNEFQTKYQDVLKQGYSSGAIIKGPGNTYQVAPETTRPYGAFSDWSASVQKLITGSTPSQFAIYETTPEFAAAPWYERVGEGIVKTATNPEQALQSGVQGLALYGLTAGVGEGLGAIAGTGGKVGSVAGGAIKIGESPAVKYGVPAVFGGAGLYSAAEGVDIGGPTLVTPKAGWSKFETNVGEMTGNLLWMGVGAALPGGLVRASPGLVSTTRNVYEATNFPNVPTIGEIGGGLKGKVSDTLYTMRQRVGGVENVGVGSGLSYYKGEPPIMATAETPKPIYATIGGEYTRGGEIGKFLDTTPTGWFESAGRTAQTAKSISSLENLPFRATDAERYAALESLYGTGRPLLAPLKPMVVEKPWTAYRTTTTSYEVSPVGTILSQKQPSGLSSIIRLKPGVITEGAPEAWTTSPRSKVTVKSSEAIRLNPYSGETLVLGRTDVLRSPAKVGVPEVSTSKAHFNIFDLPPSIAEESAMSVKPPSTGDITSLYFEKGAGTTKISSGAYRDIAKPGRGTLYRGYADEFGYLGESKKTREITSAIKDILESKEPEYGVKLSKYANVPTPRGKFAEKVAPITPAVPIGLGVKPLYETRIAGTPRVSAREVSKEPVPSKGFSTTGQQLKYAEIPVAEKMGATFKGIFGELAKAKPKQKYSAEGAMISARVEQMATRARRAEQLPEETRRFEELQRVTPSLKTVGPIVDTSEYIKYSEAMLKGLKGGGVEVGTTKSERLVPIQPNRIERQYGEIFGIGKVASPSQKILQKQLQEQPQAMVEKALPSEKSMSDTIQKSIQDILKTTSQKPSVETTQKEEEIAIRVPYEITSAIPKETTTQLPRQAQIPEVTSISRITQIPELTQRPEITLTPPEKTKLKIPVPPLPLFGSGLGGGGGGSDKRRRFKKHVEKFEYPFTPALAAVAVTKALRAGSNVTRAPKSSLPASIFTKPQQASVKVTQQPRITVPKFNAPVKKATPQFTMPKIGAPQSLKPISLPSSMPTQKKKGRK